MRNPALHLSNAHTNCFRLHHIPLKNSICINHLIHIIFNQVIFLILSVIVFIFMDYTYM
jgi:hypothetical protein